MNDSYLKQQLIEIYEDSKKIIDNHIKSINNEIKIIKNQHELFYKKALDILIKSENENENKTVLKYNLTTNTDYVNTLTNSPTRAKTKTPLKGRSSNHLKNYNKLSSEFNSFKKNSITSNKSTFNNNTKSNKKYILHNNNFSFTKSTVSQNISKIITKNKLKSIQKNIQSTKKNSFNSTTSIASNFNSMSVSSNHSFSNLDSKYSSIPFINNNYNPNGKKNDTKFKKKDLGINKNNLNEKKSLQNNNNKINNNNNKINTNINNNINLINNNLNKNNDNLRKFSIIDIPSLTTIQEKSKKINLINDEINSYDNYFTLTSDENELSDRIINKIEKQKEKCFYLVSKSNVVPLSIRILFSKNIQTIYNYNPPIQIIRDYLEFLDLKINNLNRIIFKKFFPSLTAQSSLCFIKKDDENLLLNLNISNEEEKKNVNNLLRLILLTYGRTYNDKIDYKFLIDELMKLSNNNLRKFFTNIETLKNINNLSETSIDYYLEISEKNKNMFDINCKSIPQFFEKFIFYLSEVKEYLYNKKYNQTIKNKTEEEKNRIQEKIIYSKIK